MLSIQKVVWSLSLVVADIELDLDVVWVSETDVLLFTIWIELNAGSADSDALQALEEGLEGLSIGHTEGEMIQPEAVLVESIIGERLEGWALEAQEKGAAGDASNLVIARERLDAKDLFIEPGRPGGIRDSQDNVMERTDVAGHITSLQCIGSGFLCLLILYR